MHRFYIESAFGYMARAIYKFYPEWQTQSERVWDIINFSKTQIAVLGYEVN